MNKKGGFPDRHPLIVNIASLTSYAAIHSYCTLLFFQNRGKHDGPSFAQKLAPHGIRVHGFDPRHHFKRK